ncbi:hypothetical protein BU14_0118s0026 [Porphyra umbilicalis]|uniref:Uncharacterized protein n=1 Tax=Porphyra umbilicalis TaxID=2786 RepID=A0A1X6PBS6_PORUM|nr:hypothetical protein BU14_0118s0026 [Porphyra umbilicalis]|eukprot:OSX78175.1 hypothetical protein BU14_0118s0026 [Porphyra umbilicalis]
MAPLPASPRGPPRRATTPLPTAPAGVARLPPWPLSAPGGNRRPGAAAAGGGEAAAGDCGWEADGNGVAAARLADSGGAVTRVGNGKAPAPGSLAPADRCDRPRAASRRRVATAPRRTWRRRGRPAPPLPPSRARDGRGGARVGSRRVRHPCRAAARHGSGGTGGVGRRHNAKHGRRPGGRRTRWVGRRRSGRQLWRRAGGFRA